MALESSEHVMEDWEVLSDRSSMREGAMAASKGAPEQLAAVPTPEKCSQGEHEGVVGLYLEAGDSSIQPTGLPLQPFISGQLGGISDSSEASFEAADCTWEVDAFGTRINAAAGEGKGAAAGERAAPKAQGGLCDGPSSAGANIDSAAQAGAVLGEEAPPAPTMPAAVIKAASSLGSLSDSVQSMGSVQLKLVRADEHRALQAALQALERRARLRERQLAIARARLAETDRECSLLRRVAVVACSLCAVVGLRALLGPAAMPAVPTSLAEPSFPPAGLQPKLASDLPPRIYNLYGPLQADASTVALTPASALAATQPSPSSRVELEPLVAATP